ncbi:terminase [Mesorhizobium kowhaii]|uniref:terminase n=1 Tax=Mesorhizobium kowhaii TaxID=1300272 RepID=UPI0035E6E060
MICDIDTAISDPKLLGAALGDITPWQTWRTILKAAFGMALTTSEAAVFDRLSGGRRAPTKRVQELWVIAGRRGGKSRMAAAVSAYLAAFDDHRGKLAAGETGYVMALAPSKSQARTVSGYAEGFFQQSAILREQIEATTAEEIRLKGNVAIGVHTNSFRTVRGRTLLGAVFDESAFWRDETSASPDVEVYRAILPALATTGGLLVGISSAYRKIGLIYTKFRDHFGQDDPDILVIRAGTEDLNPTIDKRIIERARKADPEAAFAEWDGEFRNDLSSLLDDASIDAAIDPDRPMELPPRDGVKYVSFTDASAGRHDSFTICVGHTESDRFIADVVRGRRAPFDPNDVAKEFAGIAKAYGCSEVVGDNFAGEWVVQAFKSAGIGYKRADHPKSVLYLESLSSFMRRAISIPNHSQLIRELRLLERRTSRSGRDSVDHPQSGGADDHANALVGALWSSTNRQTAPTGYSVSFSRTAGPSAYSVSMGGNSPYDLLDRALASKS